MCSVCPHCTAMCTQLFVPTGAPRIPTLPPDIFENSSNYTNVTTLSPSIDLTPVITPCESPYVYKIYRNIDYDALALHNLETAIVEVYNWTNMVGAEGPIVEKEYTELTEREFVSETEGSFLFVGWTVDSKLSKHNFMWSVKCNISNHFSDREGARAQE